MTYPTYQPADFRRIGYERRDEGTQPRVHVLGIFEETLEPPHRTCVIFHVAGDESERVGYLDYMVSDDELIAGMEPAAALNLGIYWQKMIQRNRAPIPADAEGQTIQAEA